MQPVLMSSDESVLMFCVPVEGSSPWISLISKFVLPENSLSPFNPAVVLRSVAPVFNFYQRKMTQVMILLTSDSMALALFH